MKPLLTYVWQRRWCRMLATVAIVFAVAQLHPFVRQSIFGPTIEEIPWCVWEEQVRRTVEPTPPERTWFLATLEKFGLAKEREGKLDLNAASTLPLYLHLANDRDIKVRRFALGQLTRPDWIAKNKSTITPVMRELLRDADPVCRVGAAWAVWHATKDADMKPICLMFLDNSDPLARAMATAMLGDMASEMPELIEPLSKMLTDSEDRVRGQALYSMSRFGKRSVPHFQVALHDPKLRNYALGAVRFLRDGDALFPDLVQLQNDPDSDIRRAASHALYSMDPKQFAKPATWVDR